jgi:hypothetical protein
VEVYKNWRQNPWCDGIFLKGFKRMSRKKKLKTQTTENEDTRPREQVLLNFKFWYEGSPIPPPRTTRRLKQHSKKKSQSQNTNPDVATTNLEPETVISESQATDEENEERDAVEDDSPDQPSSIPRFSTVPIQQLAEYKKWDVSNISVSY